MNNSDHERVGPMLNPPHVGELIRESMEETGWTVSQTAARLGCGRGTLSRVLNSRSGVSAHMSLALESIGWGTADHWVRMPNAIRLPRHLMRIPGPTHRGPIIFQHRQHFQARGQDQLLELGLPINEDIDQLEMSLFWGYQLATASDCASPLSHGGSFAGETFTSV